VDIIRATTVADVLSANSLYDKPATEDVAATFLATPGHHLFVARNGASTVGFVSGVEMVHPDKGTEMFLYELAVDESMRRQGIGTALIEALADLAKRSGCYDMWVLVDEGDEIPQAVYKSAGGNLSQSPHLFTWDFAENAS
jgi:ribosomal protein S18 acetylase RimI-like enzyme